MCASLVAERSFEQISRGDLERLAKLALNDLEALYQRRPDTGRLYRDRLIALALCQGAAEHFVNGKRGVKDFDVWGFFRSAPERKFPYRRRGVVDFGDSKFGRRFEKQRFVGRHVDVMGRDIPFEPSTAFEDTIRSYLKAGKTKSAWHLSKRPVVLIWPPERLGEVIWNPNGGIEEAKLPTGLGHDR